MATAKKPVKKISALVKAPLKAPFKKAAPDPTPPLKAKATKRPGFKLPKTIGACADAAYSLRMERLAAQKIVDSIKAEETQVREYIIQNLPKSESTGVAGKLARVTVMNDDVPQVDDWAKLYAHIKKTGDFDLLQRRVSNEAVQERWDNGKQIPGVKVFHAVKLSLNKV